MAEYLLAARLGQLCEQAAAPTQTPAAAPWTNRLTGLVGGTAGAVMA
ncbi:hypothetical protein [Streptomyces sp.]|nr:hypothetical protein [Streptomyces sp.]